MAHDQDEAQRDADIAAERRLAECYRINALTELAEAIASQDEFTGAEHADIPLRQAYALINAWRERAKIALRKA